jgi:hypothetical protein
VRYTVSRSGIYWMVTEIGSGRVFAWTGNESNARLMAELLNREAK